MKRLLIAAVLSAAPIAAFAESHSTDEAAAAETVDYAAEVAALGGDAAAGEKVYRKCRACHAIDKPQRKVGPHQVGIIGRPAAVVEKFKYSKAMMAAAEDNPNTDEAGDGIVWNAATLTEYLKAPKKYIKGTKMAFAGLKKEQDVKDVIAYMLDAGGVYEPES